MHRFLLTLAILSVPVLSYGQTNHTMTHSGSHETMNHGEMMSDPGEKPVTEPGQGAFAAIGEIVAALEADPTTDWSVVNIAGLREHLRDMDVVMIDAVSQAEDVPGGIRFIVTGGLDVSPSIRRMALAHAGIMQGVDGWQYQASEVEHGATVTVLVPDQDLAKLKALGFFGMLTAGMHHQEHHWIMATGGDPHQ